MIKPPPHGGGFLISILFQAFQNILWESDYLLRPLPLFLHRCHGQHDIAPSVTSILMFAEILCRHLHKPSLQDGRGVRFIVATHKISLREIFDTAKTSFINDTGGLQAFA